MQRSYFVLLIVFGLSGCMSFKETHLFRDNTANVSNYYRLKINGYTFLSKSRYVSGYFDDNAVLEYFGEFSQPDTSISVFLKKKRKAKEDVLSKTSKTELAGEIAGKKLVMILSANSKGVADQIGSIAENQQLVNAISSMVSQDDLLALQETTSEFNQKQEDYQKVQKSVALMLNNLDSASNFRTNEVYLLAAVNTLLDELGYADSIDSLAQLNSILKIIE